MHPKSDEPLDEVVGEENNVKSLNCSFFEPVLRIGFFISGQPA